MEKRVDRYIRIDTDLEHQHPDGPNATMEHEEFRGSVALDQPATGLAIESFRCPRCGTSVVLSVRLSMHLN